MQCSSGATTVDVWNINLGHKEDRRGEIDAVVFRMLVNILGVKGMTTSGAR
jgi:uncharacterized membrane protein YobD (UPF0266 family)